MPMGNGDVPADDEDLSFLSGHWKIFQKRSGHRWSLDDLVTAWVASREMSSAREGLDLGCGLGSVLLLCAWKLPESTWMGIEAQSDRAALARRSIDWNGVAHRCRILVGDFREGFEGKFDLITGTPPYFPTGTGTVSKKTHAHACRFELRGDAQAYVDAAMPHLNDDGVLVLCANRPVTSNPALRLSVVPKVGKAPLIWIEVVRTQASATRHEELVVRDHDNQWTPEFCAVRRAMGLPDRSPSRKLA